MYDWYISRKRRRKGKCQRRAKGGLPRATSKKQGKRRAWQGALPKAGQFGNYGHDYKKELKKIDIYLMILIDETCSNPH